MTTPSVVEVDPTAPQTLSPIKDYTSRSGEPEWKNDESRRSRKHAVDMKNFKEMRTKYQEAKKRMERMKEESAHNKRMLLEMSSVINALKNISVDYDHDDSGSSTPTLNIQKKIQAIDDQLSSAMMQCSNLEEEKKNQTSTIQAQEGQIQTMEQKIAELENKLEESMAEKNKAILAEKETLDRMNRDGEMASTVKAQEGKIAALETQLRKMEAEKSSTVYREIQTFRGAYEAKYQEINAMEEKLAVLRRAQTDQSVANSSSQHKPVKHVSFVPEPVTQLDHGKNSSYDQSSQSSQSSSTNSTSRSSRTGSRLCLQSIWEETTTPAEDDDLYSDDRGYAFSARTPSADSSVTDVTDKDEDNRPSINITASTEEGVEVSVGSKGGSINVSDVSYETEESTKSSTVNFEDEYNNAMCLVEKLRADNENLRMNHRQALSDMAQISELTFQANQTKEGYDEMKQALNEQRHSATLANTKYEKLRREYSKVAEELKEERSKYSQLAHDYGKIAHRESDLAGYDQLKQMHNAVVMKLGDIGEENETLMTERNAARCKQEQSESRIRELISELEGTTMAYESLQKENDEMNTKMTKLSEQCDTLKTKYYELLAGDQSIHTESTHSQDERYEMLRREYETAMEKLRAMEAKIPANTKLKRDYSEALAKIAVLEQSNQELETFRDQYHAADARVIVLQRQHEQAVKDAKLAKKREDQRASHLKDMLAHYKTLEKEYEEVTKKLKHLQAVMSKDGSGNEDVYLVGPPGPGALEDQTKEAALQSRLEAYERRMKELQQQRDASIQQLNHLEEELSQTKLEKIEAQQARKDRERDLKVVLGHYHELQNTHNSFQGKKTETENAAVNADSTNHTVSTTLAVLAKRKEEKQGGNDEKEKPEAEEKEPTQEKKDPTQEAKGETKSNDEAKTERQETIDVEVIPEGPEDEVTENQDEQGEVSSPEVVVQEADKMDDTGRPEPDVLDEDSVVRLLIDMDELRRQKQARLAEHAGKGDRTDMSDVSNVSEGLSLDKSVLSDEAPSTGWKDVKIAKLLSELEQAKSQVWALEEKEKSAQHQMEITERKLMVATREAENAKHTQTSRESNLRTAIATQKRLESDYQQSQEAVKFLQIELEKAKKEARMREEETKAARKRAASYHTQFKKLQEKHNEAMKVLQEQEQQLQQLGGTKKAQTA